MKKEKADALRKAQCAVFSQRLQQAMIMRGMRQKELAEAVEVPISTIWAWANGLRLPQAHALCVAADVLGVSVDWLLGRAAQAGMTYHGRMNI